ncbi:MAG: selenocysteine-specific translation elongation factor [Acidimicrobiales bacterium]
MIVATAGHVDHGKSTLVQALTGTDPDRLAEERRRGLTIELGFAWTELERAGVVSFVDVPGHRDFIRTMIAGVAAVHAALLVVDAREGWRSQTVEHLQVLELTDVRHLVVAVTKADLADRAMLHHTLAATERTLAPSAFAASTVVACDAVTGTGLDELRGAIDDVCSVPGSDPTTTRPRLWIDRAFTLAGAGTVVTGSLSGGSLTDGDMLDLVGREGTRRVRVRRLQSHGLTLGTAPPGVRVAVNLAEIHHRSVHRGDALVRPTEWETTRTVDVSLRVSAHLDHDVTRTGAYTLHVGTAAETASVRLLGTTRLAPGATGVARLHVDRPLPLVLGDRFVLMESGRSELVGGGEVLDVGPVLPASRARPDGSIDRLIAERGWIDTDELERISGHRRAPTAGRWVVDPTALSEAERTLVARVEQAGDHGIDLGVLDERQRAVADRLLATGRLDLVDGAVRTAGSQRAGDDRDALDALRLSPFSPPDPADLGVDPTTVARWRRQGLAMSNDGIAFPAEALPLAAARLIALLADRSEGATVGEIAAALGTSRKYAVPLLGLLDREGVTRRVGDRRVAGGRLDRVAATDSPPES